MSNTVSQAPISEQDLSAVLERNVLTVAKGGGINFASTLFAYVARFGLGIILTRLLGAEHFGLYNLAFTAASIASGLALLGLPSALVRYVSLFASRRDSEGVWGTLQVGVGYPAVCSVLLGLCLWMGAGFIAVQLFHEPHLIPLLRLSSLLVPFLTISGSLAAATRGFKKMQYTAISQNISQPTIKLIMVLLLAISGLSAAKVLTAHLLAVVFITGMLVYGLNRLFSLRRSVKMARRRPRDMLRFSLPLYLDYLIRTFQGNVQTVLLGALNTAATVGIFTAANQVNVIGQMFHHSIVTASMPIISELFGLDKRKQMAHFYQVMTKWTFMANLPLFLIVLLFAKPILSIFGEDFVGGHMALAILAWGNLLQTGTGICGVVINMTGNTLFNLVNSILLSVLTLVLNLLLIPRYDIVGAAIATVMAVVLVNLLRLGEVYILFRMLPYNRSFVKPSIAGLVTLVAGWGMRQWLNTDVNYAYAIVGVGVLFLVYVGVVLALGLAPEDRVILARIHHRARSLLRH